MQISLLVEDRDLAYCFLDTMPGGIEEHGSGDWLCLARLDGE